MKVGDEEPWESISFNMQREILWNFKPLRERNKFAQSLRSHRMQLWPTIPFWNTAEIYESQFLFLNLSRTDRLTYWATMVN